MQIIVLGMHRSGTSLITRLINMMGAYFGPERMSIGFAPDNPKGFWERRDVLQINDEILGRNSCRWNNLAAWPTHSTPWLAPEQERRLRYLVMEMDAHRPFVLKDPRLCLLLDYWKPHLEVPVFVLVHRDPREVARSLEKRNGLPLDFSLALWEYHVVKLLNSVQGLPCIHARHADALSDPQRFTADLLTCLEGEGVQSLRMPSQREISAFIEPALYRARASEKDLTLTPHQQLLVSLMTGERLHHSPLEISPESVARMRRGV